MTNEQYEFSHTEKMIDRALTRLEAFLSRWIINPLLGAGQKAED